MEAGHEAPTGESQARRLEVVAERLTELLRRPEAARFLRAAPGENEWSSAQVLGHTVEMIPYWMGHCEAMIAAGEPPHTFGRTFDAPERVAGIGRFASGNPEEVLQALNGAVRAAAGRIRGMSEEERRRKGVYTKGGEFTVAEVIERFLVAHAEDHLAQVRAALGA